MSSGVLDTIDEYPPLGVKSKNPKLVARNNLNLSKTPQPAVEKSFTVINGRQNNGQKYSGQRVNQHATRYQTQNMRDKTPEDNDKSFLKYAVSLYKEILIDNYHLLEASSTLRPPVIDKIESERREDDHGILDIMDEWNAEYAHAQKVLNVCRSQLRSSLMKQYVIMSSDTQDTLRRYNLDFKKFKTISTKTAQQKKPVMDPARWFTKRIKNASDDKTISFYKQRVYFEERQFLGNIIQKFIELIEREINEVVDIEFGSLKLLKFDFDNSDVQEWTTFYKNMKQSRNEEQKWPKLPAVCCFENSNPTGTSSTNKDDTDEDKIKRKEVLHMFSDFKSQYNSWINPQTTDHSEMKSNYRQNETGLRIWFHTRAWNAFRKAIQSNLINQDKKDGYMEKNRIEQSGNKYLVLGSTMARAIPPTSCASYLVSFER